MYLYGNIVELLYRPNRSDWQLKICLPYPFLFKNEKDSSNLMSMIYLITSL